MFLRNIAVDWPRQPDFLQELSVDDPEVKKTEVCRTQLKFSQRSDCLHRLFRRYSNFKNLQRTVMWLLRFIEFLKMKTNPHYATPNQQSITVAEMIRAERAIVRVAQSQVFGDIIPVLRNHKGFHDTVKLITEQQLRDNPSVRKLQTLNPYLVDGIIRVGGRLERSTLSLEEKHPIILPNQHPVTELLVLMYHEREGHMGCSQVLTAMYKTVLDSQR